MKQIIFILLSISMACAAILHVPSQYPSIQAGLNAAAEGDTVQVAAGTYFENIVWPETDNLYLIGSSAESCVIDGSYLGYCIDARFYFYPVITLTIQNFRITHGTGGITLYNTNSQLQNLVITQNYCQEGVCHNAVHVTNSNSVFTNTSIHHNVSCESALRYNNGSDITFSEYDRCSIYSNTILRNIPDGIFVPGLGSDIQSENGGYVVLDTFTVMQPTNLHALPVASFTFDILNGIIPQSNSDIYVSPDGNNANDGLTPTTALKNIYSAASRIVSSPENPKSIILLDGIYSQSNNDEIFPLFIADHSKLHGLNSYGAIIDKECTSSTQFTSAILISDTDSPKICDLLISNAPMYGIIGYRTRSAEIQNVRLDRELCTEYARSAIKIWDSPGTSIINDVFVSNFGQGVDAKADTVIVLNSIFSNNTGNWSSGLTSFEYSFMKVDNCVFYNNYGDINLPLLEIYGATMHVNNCIFLDNGSEESNYYGEFTVNYSNNWDGSTNFNGNPYFVDAENANFHLLPWSPNIDAGNPDGNNNGLTWEDDPEDQDPDGSRKDVGAFFVDKNNLTTGDFNFDNIVNIQDIILLVNLILGTLPENTLCITIGDLDGSGTLEITDIVLVVSLVMEG